MSGVKGRSGKLTTSKQKTSASERGKKGMAARWGTSLLPPPTGDPSAEDPVLRLGKPVTWGDELKRQQVEGERIQNRRREVEVQRAEVELAKAQDEHAKERGQLRSLEWIRERDASRVDIILSHLPILVDAALATHPPEQQPKARHAMDQAVAEFRRKVSESLRPVSNNLT